MRKILLITALIFAIAFTSFAQSNSTWKNLAPANEEFSLEAPESMALSEFSPRGRDDTKLYKTAANGTYFFIVSGKNDNSNLSKLHVLLVEANKAESAETTVDNLPGRKFRFTDAEGLHQEILIIGGKARVYVFHTVSDTKDNPAVERFFSSLRFDKTIPEASKTSTEESAKKSSAEETAKKIDSTENQENRKAQINSDSGTGNGTGSGTGNGVGSGSVNQQTQPSTENQTSVLKILSKPRAEYTDLARFYEITGSVQVRVTFLANGEIGSVAPVSRLPFGLTTNAVNAARNMRFEPARREGTAYTVTEMVVYSFVIY